MTLRIPACIAWMSAPRTKSWQPQLRMRWAYSGPRLKIPHGLPDLRCGLRDGFNRFETFGVFKIAGDAEDLAQVGRPDEEQVDVRNRCDLCRRLE